MSLVLRECRAPAAALRRLIEGLAGGAGEIAMHTETPWQSITFSGTRHVIGLQFKGAAQCAQGEGLIAAVGATDWTKISTVPGHLIAAVTTTRIERRLNTEELDIGLDILLLEQ